LIDLNDYQSVVIDVYQDEKWKPKMPELRRKKHSSSAITSLLSELLSKNLDVSS
jgi:hypothetical protein